MNVRRHSSKSVALLITSVVAFSGFCGCQTNIGGQTLPSANYIRDDVQFFPAGPEFILPQTKRAHEEYRASQIGAEEGFEQVP